MSKGHGHQVALVLGVLAGQHGHTVIVTYPYAYMTYIVSSLAGLGGGILWRPPAYSLLKKYVQLFIVHGTEMQHLFLMVICL